jgi:hypothetical protein
MFLFILTLFFSHVPQDGSPSPTPTSSEWRYLATSEAGTNFYFLRRSASAYYPEVWFKSSAAGEVSVSLRRYNCVSGGYRLLQINTFKANELVNSSVYNDSEWGYSRPDTIGEDMLRAACGHRKRDWTYMGSSTEDESYFLKLDSLVRTGKIVRVWAQTSEADVRKAVTLYEFDCVQDRIRIIQSTSYRGNETGSSTRATPWSYIVPDSVGEMLAKEACKHRTPRQKPSRR